jgi:hypothetical protein
MSIAAGYYVETAVFAVISFGTLSASCFQLFYVWNLPHNKERVKTLQKAFIFPIVFNSFLHVVLSVDHRCVFGFYPPLLVVILFALVTVPAMVSMLFWYRTLVTVVDSASMSIAVIRKWNTVLTIKQGHIWFFFTLHCSVSIVLIVITARSNLMWYWAFMFGYFVLFSVVLLIHQSILVVLLWKQYSEMRDLNQRLYFSGDKLIGEDHQNNRSTVESSASAKSISTKDQSISSSYATTQDLRIQRLLNLVKTFLRAAVCTLIAIAAELGALNHLASRPDFTIQDEVATDPQVYTVNWDMAILLTIFTTVRFFGIFSVWLPVFPKQKRSTPAQAIEMN